MATLDAHDSTSSWPPTTALHRPRPPPVSVRVTQQAWTITRCHRLLRPLKTHVAALRREAELEDAEGLSDEAAAARAQTVGRIRHTYSRRGRRPKAGGGEPPRTPKVARKLSRKQALQPGEIVLPTPMIRIARGQQLSSPTRQQPSPSTTTTTTTTTRPEAPKRCRKARDLASSGRSASSSVISALEMEMLPLRSRISSARYSLYESILRAAHALLVATADPTPTATAGSSRRCGTKSLMDLVLRRVPDYIGELEAWEEREAEEKGTKSALRVSEVSNEVYQAVEESLPPGHGCPHLRLIVRAHGFKVVRDALLDGLLEDSFSSLLVKLCARMKANVEVEALLAIIVDRSYPKPKSVGSTFDEGRRLAPLKMLRDFAHEAGRSQYMLRRLSELISRQQLPPDWLSTKEFSSVWSGIVKSLSDNETCDDTVSFAIQMITTLSSQAKTAAFILRPEAKDLRSFSQRTLLSAITAMVSLPLLRQEAGHSITQHHFGQNSVSAISSRVGYVIQACIYELRRSRKSGWIPTLLHLAAYFTSNTYDSAKCTDIAELWRSIIQDHNSREGKQHYEAATALLCSVAQCCGRGTPEPSHHYLTRLCDGIDSAAAIEASMSRDLRIDCAFLLAERTNDLRDLALAESFNVTSDRTRSCRRTPRNTSASSSAAGFRWDEGISEWVTETPAVRKQPPRQSLMEDPSSDSDADGRQAPGGTSDDYPDSAFGGDFDSDSSASQDDRCRRMTRQTRAATRQGCSRKQGKAEQRVTRGRKRSIAATGLLSLQSEDDLEGQDEQFMAGRQKESTGSQQRSTGKESSALMPSGDPPKRRRVSSLRSRRSTLQSTSSGGPEELSDDELGL